MELTGSQRGSINSPVLDHLYASLDAELLCPKFWPKLWNSVGRNHGTMLVEIFVNFTVPSVPSTSPLLPRNFLATFT